jgi:hypothetical protein
MNDGAEKCTECDSYQDWTRHIFRWSGVGAAVIAVVPLWGMAWSLWQIAMPTNADIRVSTMACSPNQITVAAANIGQKTGVIKNVEFAVVRDPAPQKDVYRDTRNLTTDQIVAIKPNDVVIVKYQPVSGGPEDLPIKQSSASCRYELTFTALGLGISRSDQTTATCDCPT